MGEIHELFVLALSLVWFAGATPDCYEIFEQFSDFTAHPPHRGFTMILKVTNVIFLSGRASLKGFFEWLRLPQCFFQRYGLLLQGHTAPWEHAHLLHQHAQLWERERELAQIPYFRYLIWGSDFDPHPQPQSSLLRIFRLQPGLEWKFLLSRTWSGQKLLPLQFPRLSRP